MGREGALWTTQGSEAPHAAAGIGSATPVAAPCHEEQVRETSHISAVDPVWDPFAQSRRIVPPQPRDMKVEVPLRLDDAPRERGGRSVIRSARRFALPTLVVGAAIFASGVAQPHAPLAFLGLLVTALACLVYAATGVFQLMRGLVRVMGGLTNDMQQGLAREEAFAKLGLAWSQSPGMRTFQIPRGAGTAQEYAIPRIEMEGWGHLPDGSPFWSGFGERNTARLTKALSQLGDRYGNSGRKGLSATFALGFPLPRDTRLVATALHTRWANPRTATIDTASDDFNNSFRLRATSGLPGAECDGTDLGHGTRADLNRLLTPATKQVLLDLVRSYDQLVFHVVGDTAFLTVNDRLATRDVTFLAAWLADTRDRLAAAAVRLRVYTT